MSSRCYDPVHAVDGRLFDRTATERPDEVTERQQKCLSFAFLSFALVLSALVLLRLC
jgi:hypothetical protein